MQVHHDYRSGLLEHILKIMEISTGVAEPTARAATCSSPAPSCTTSASSRSCPTTLATEYTVEGNLVGHMAIGVGMLRDDGARPCPAFPPDLRLELTHLILSHHGAKELGSPVEPMTVEAFILAACDDLDAKIHQIRRHLADDDTDGRFTTYHRG